MSEKSGSKTQFVDGISRPKQATAKPVELPKLTETPLTPTVVSLADEPFKKNSLKHKILEIWQKIRPKTRRQTITYGAIGAGLVVLTLIGFFVMTSCRVFVCSDGDGALALQEEVDPT